MVPATGKPTLRREGAVFAQQAEKKRFLEKV